MRIALLAPVEERVPPLKYGGTEVVVYNLAQHLTRMGHEVVLFATGDSWTEATLISIFPEPIRTLPISRNPKVRQALTITGIGRMLGYLSQYEFDVVHNHIGWLFLPFVQTLRMPVVTTLHGSLGNPDESEIYRLFAKENYVSISRNQRMSGPPGMNFLANVYNGIEITSFNYVPEPGRYLAFLARISHEKGALQAIQIAKDSGEKLVMAGKVDPADATYFEEQIKPLIDGEQIKFIGEIGHKDKVKLLGHAKAILCPIQWDEPFGLYFIEAMACGTPVIANRRGSVPEVIQDGVTGYIVDTVEEAVARIADIGKIDRLACRRHVEDNFSADAMAEGYLEAYEAVLDRRHESSCSVMF
ncbi:MAG: glycosyltransferase family 4 protein [Candidatus Moranbacteria bacterium]|nr:glycosyltransferase family 4 protein [Candidatus Moranbacteria bacterium]